MSVASRLSKLEAASGVNEPCSCETWVDEQSRLLTEKLIEQGVTLHVPKPEDLRMERCAKCGGLFTLDLTFVSRADRRKVDRLGAEEQAALATGGVPRRAWWEQMMACAEREQAAHRAYYGEPYDIAYAQTDLPSLWRRLYERIKEIPE